MANGRSDGTVYIDTKIDTSGISKGMNDAGKRVNALSSSMRNLGNQIKSAFSRGIETRSSSANLAKLEADIKRTEMQLDKLIEKQIRFVETGGNIKSRTMAGMEYDIEMTRNKLEQLRQTLANTTQDAPRRFERMKKSIDKVTKSISNLNKGTKKTHMSLLRMLGTSLLFSTVFRAISTVTKGFKEGMENITEYSDEANASMSKLKSALTQLKNSFAAAFSPILTAVTPALVSFINLISRAMNTVAAFFAALSGKTTYTKAVEVQEDYREALEGTAEAAKEAKKYLTGLDEIRTFTADDVPTGGVSVGDMFEEEEIDSPILKFAEKFKEILDKIKQYIKDGDWHGLGEFISKGIVAGFDFLSNLIDQVDWTQLGKNIGEFLAGLDWWEIIKAAFKLKFNIWKAIAEAWFGAFTAAPIETTIITALGLLKFTGLGTLLAGKIKTALLGGIVAAFTSLGTAFTSLGGLSGILTADLATIFGAGTLAEIGLTIGTGILGGILAAILGFDFGKWIGEKLFPEDAEWYKNFTWFGEEGFFDTIFNTDASILADAFLTMITDALTEVGNRLGNWDTTKELFDSAGFFFEKVKEDFEKKDWGAIGKDIIDGIVAGFLGVLSAITEPFMDLFSWIWDGICAVFGIHSPAAEMEPLGENILKGIIVGFESAISFFTETISNWWENNVKPWFTTEKWEGILGGIKTAFSNTFTSAINKAIDLLNSFIDFVNSKLNISFDGFSFMGKEIFPAGNFQLFTIPNIPKLATGAVIPPNAPFLAMLGDQKRGTNIEAPLDTIKQAVREVVGSNNVSGDVRIPVQIDGNTLLEVIVSKAQIMQAANGDNILVTLGG